MDALFALFLTQPALVLEFALLYGTAAVLADAGHALFGAGSALPAVPLLCQDDCTTDADCGRCVTYALGIGLPGESDPTESMTVEFIVAMLRLVGVDQPMLGPNEPASRAIRVYYSLERFNSGVPFIRVQCPRCEETRCGFLWLQTKKVCTTEVSGWHEVSFPAGYPNSDTSTGVGQGQRPVRWSTSLYFGIFMAAGQVGACNAFCQ